MLPGFPKTVKTVKLAHGRYRLIRDDGYTVDIVRAIGGWWFGNTGQKIKSLSLAEYDVKHGFTAWDFVNAQETAGNH